MRYAIETLKENSLDWNAKGELRVLQNIKNLITTWRYEVAYDRTKGMNPSILYLPKDDAIALYTAEIYRLIETYQPDVQVVSVDFLKVDEEGNMDFKVVVEL